MSSQPWLRFGLFVPMLAALLLVLAMACGSSATAIPQVTEVTAVPEVAQVAAATAVPEVAQVVEQPEGPKYGGTLVVGMVPNYSSIDPPLAVAVWDNALTENTYDNLIAMNPNMTLKPELATSWEANDDLSSFTFHLREGVKFHHGKDFKAEDVLFSFERLMDPVIDSPARSTFEKVIEDIVAVDDYTVRFDLSGPNGFFLESLTIFQARIVASDVDPKRLHTETFGTGPFKILEHLQGQRTVFVRNDDYWDEGLPYLDEIVFLAIPEAATRIEALKSGDIDLVFNLDAQSVASVEGNANTTVLRASTSAYIGMDMNNTIPPFDNKLVRQAMQAAMDREKINQAALLGLGLPAFDHPIHPSDAFFAPQYAPPDYDPDLARSLLEQAGYPDGIDVTLHMADLGAGVADMAVAYKESAAPAGIRVDIKKRPSDAYWDVVWLVEPFTVVYWRGRNADQALSIQYHSDSSWNASYWNNPTVDGLIEKARTQDFEGQKESYAEIQRILIDEVPKLIPAFQPWMYGASKDLRGVVPHPLGNRHIQDGWLDR